MESDRKLTNIERLLPVATLVATMVFVASMSFRSVFDGWVFVVAPLLAVVGATAIGIFGVSKRLLVGEVVGLSFVGYLLVGVVAVGGLPVPRSFLSLMSGVTSGWITMLDSLPPADATGDLRALPFTAAWLGAAVGIAILRRSSRVGLAAFGPLLSLTVAVLFSMEQRRLVLFQGILLAVLFLLLVTIQFEMKRRVAGEFSGPRPLRIALGASILIGVVALSPALANRIIPDSPAGRIELRQLRPSPWDPLSVPSPMTQVKSYLAADLKDEVALTITGPTIDRVRIAALEDYDGRVWAVADVSLDAPAEFKPAGPSLPGGIRTGDPVEYTIEIRGLRMPWLPVVAQTVRVDFLDGDLDKQPMLQMNQRTRTLAVPNDVVEGTTYAIRAYKADVPDIEDLEASRVSYDSNRFGLDLLPPDLQNRAADIVEGVDPGWGQVEALQGYLRDTGFYAEDSIAPGHSYARIGTFLGTLEVPVGYTEQYGAGGAVLARAVNLPSRVVLGFVIPKDRFRGGSADVLFGDVTAWVEVLTDEYGWVVVDVTPDKSRKPESKGANKTTKIVASPNPPPPPPTSTTSTTIPLGADEEIKDQVIEEEEAPDEPAGLAALPDLVRVAILGISIPVLLLLIGIFVIIVTKMLVRRTRRNQESPAARVAGAWYETLDRYREAGYNASPRSTPSELADEFAKAGAPVSSVGTLEELAIQVDRAAFHVLAPSDERAEVAWQISDTAVDQVHSGHTVWQRLKMAADPSTVLRPSRRGHPGGQKRAWRRGGFSHAN